MSMNWQDETWRHIHTVQEFMGRVIAILTSRAHVHDQSKLGETEGPVFAEYTAKLKGSTYGSPEYKQFLADMKPALDHHYANNSHHPEHYPGGVDEMDLLDLIEMLCDWKAATLRHADGDMGRSLKINAERFAISPQLARVLENTVRRHIEPAPSLAPGAGEERERG